MFAFHSLTNFFKFQTKRQLVYVSQGKGDECCKMGPRPGRVGPVFFFKSQVINKSQNLYAVCFQIHRYYLKAELNLP